MPGPKKPAIPPLVGTTHSAAAGLSAPSPAPAKDAPPPPTFYAGAAQALEILAKRHPAPGNFPRILAETAMAAFVLKQGSNALRDDVLGGIQVPEPWNGIVAAAACVVGAGLVVDVVSQYFNIGKVLGQGGRVFFRRNGFSRKADVLELVFGRKADQVFPMDSIAALASHRTGHVLLNGVRVSDVSERKIPSIAREDEFYDLSGRLELNGEGVRMNWTYVREDRRAVLLSGRDLAVVGRLEDGVLKIAEAYYAVPRGAR